MAEEKGRIKIINIFKSIDGEAYNAGYPTIFLRTYGCNLRCTYCDTAESWNMDRYNELYGRPLKELTAEDAFNEIVELAGDITHVTITGGEPLMPENILWMKQLTSRLLARGFTVDFETNGAVSLKDMALWRDNLHGLMERVHFIMDWKCPSSKMTPRMSLENLECLTAWDVVKCVVADEDFDEVLNLRAKIPVEIPIYISPSFGKVDMKKIPEFVMEHADLNFRAQLQQHKYFWDPATKDV